MWIYFRMSVPTKRFYKVISILLLIGILAIASISTLTYFFGVSKGTTKCEASNTGIINEQLRNDNEILQEELGKYSDTDPYDYLLHN